MSDTTPTDDYGKRPTLLSYGGGVQTTALLKLVLDGTVHADGVIFADTQWEPEDVYRQVWQAAEWCHAAAMPFYVVTAGSLLDAVLSGGFVPIPATLNGSMGARQCTWQYKLRPIYRFIRDHWGGAKMLVGITIDEIERAKPARRKYIENVFPLLDLGFHRRDAALLAPDAPKSSCIGCPYRSANEWRALTTAEFAHAVAVDAAIRPNYLHPKGKPLAEVAYDADQLDLFDGCDSGCRW